MSWGAVAAGSVGCYLLKLAGLSLPRRVVANASVRRVADLLPVALLASLVAIQTFSTGTRLAIDPRAAGVGAAVVAVLARAPFLAVVVVAVVVTAVVRHVR